VNAGNRHANGHGLQGALIVTEPPDPLPIDLGTPEDSLRSPEPPAIRDGSFAMLWSSFCCAAQAAMARGSPISVGQSLADCRQPGGSAVALAGPDEFAPAAWLIAWPDGAVACWRGTSNFRQAILFALGSSVTTPVGFLGGVNSAFYQAGQVASGQLSAALPAPARPLILSGHSYGAAVAQVVSSIRAHAGSPPAGVVTWGCPKVGTTAWRDTIGSPVIRVETTGDVITGLPPTTGLIGAVYSLVSLDWWRWQGYVPAGQGWGLGSGGELFRQRSPSISLASVVAAVVGLDGGLDVDFSAHDMSEYARRLLIRWSQVEPWLGAGWARPQTISEVLSGP
jgi:hypothetical protein